MVTEYDPLSLSALVSGLFRESVIRIEPNVVMKVRKRSQIQLNAFKFKPALVAWYYFSPETEQIQLPGPTRGATKQLLAYFLAHPVIL